MNTLSPEETTKHVNMINTPDNWPCWPALPLKRYPEGGFMEAAVILEQPMNLPIRVYLTNMFMGVTKETPYREYPTAQAVVADGWVVD